ncbi:MAG TPA: S-layer homology domain-containing protein [Casimicrobiaceae bacterium]|nr:S-layer homology domain-containing protein [Casimicrobiaceae bacterium]
MIVDRLLRAACVAALALGFPVAVPAQPSPLPRVFGPSAVAASAKRAAPATVEAREVAADRALLAGLARAHVAGGTRPRFALDLFPEMELEAEVTSAEIRASGLTLFARLPGRDHAHAVLTLEQGVLVGSISLPGATVVLEPAGDGRTRIARKATNLYPGEREPRTRFTPMRRSQAPFAPLDVPEDSGRLIDVMVLWTPAAAAAAGGTQAIEAIAQGAVDQANIVYLNSGIAQRLRLVHRQAVAYAERGSGCPDPINGGVGSDAFECALYDVTGTADGQMDDVHGLRDLHGADLVALLIQDPSFCGIGWMPQPPTAGTDDMGFAVVAQACAIGNHSFVHELGHTMGAHHDPFALLGGACPDGREAGAFCFSRGLVNVTQRWRTVMAYNAECASFGLDCPRIDFMSNPMLELGGDPIGEASTRNNALTVNRTAKAVAAYRPTSDLLHPVPPRFSDVLASHPFHGHVEFLAQAGLTAGCTGTAFCPDAPVTRDQAAVILERARRAANWTPPAALGLFADVPVASAFAPWIEALRNDAITTGCTATTYCPDHVVTRAQVAALLLKARCGASFVPGTPAVPTFTDVPPSHPFFAFVEKLYADGVTTGCTATPRRYCPDLPVSRGQFAALVERSYPFPTPTEACAP